MGTGHSMFYKEKWVSLPSLHPVLEDHFHLLRDMAMEVDARTWVIFSAFPSKSLRKDEEENEV